MSRSSKPGWRHGIVSGKRWGKTCIFLGSMIEDEDDVPSRVENSSLWCLGGSIKMLAEADAAYFLDGWAGSDECIIEHEACKLYGIEIIKELREVKE